MSHRLKFIEKVEEIIKITNLNDIIEKYYYKYTLNEMFEMIDNKISYVLEKARQFAEGPK